MTLAKRKRPQTESKTSDPDSDPIGERIVKAAAECFIQYGFSGVNTAEIAAKARTSKRAIYERYGGKDRLFEGVMEYLCSLEAASDGLPPCATDRLSDILKFHARAVVSRFVRSEARDVFVAAISANQQIPTILDIFWNKGPGLAAKQIADALRSAKRAGSISVARPNEEARRFLMDCCGPFVLDMLFDASRKPRLDRYERHIEHTIASFIERVQQ
jgi:TetR/AcrR family transcriptional regulator, mexJK operon transcriptional repressor